MRWEWFLRSLRVHSCMVVQNNLDGWRWGETSVIQMFRANLPEKVQQAPQKVLGRRELGDGLCALCSWQVKQVLTRVGGWVGPASLGMGTSRWHPRVDVTAIDRDGALSLPLLSAVISSGFSLWPPPGQTWARRHNPGP